MLGNVKIAERLAAAMEQRPTLSEMMGLGLIGQGTARFVFLVENVVYKIEHGRFGCWGGNEREYTNYLKFRDRLPFPFALPEMTLYNDVIAAQYIPGTECHEAEILREFWAETYFEDIAPENVLMWDGLYYLVDFD